MIEYVSPTPPHLEVVLDPVDDRPDRREVPELGLHLGLLDEAALGTQVVPDEEKK